MNWIFWLVLVIVLSFVEIATVSLVSIWFVASGIVAMILSFFIEDTAIITTIFILLGIFLLVISRPIVNKLRSKDNEKTNLDRIIGETAIVTEDIKKNVVGEVKVDGKRWSAVSKEKCLKGDTVKV
jgi:membrane protein implicated in regulation of membrane protease activity